MMCPVKGCPYVTSDRNPFGSTYRVEVNPQWELLRHLELTDDPAHQVERQALSHLRTVTE